MGSDSFTALSISFQLFPRLLFALKIKNHRKKRSNQTKRIDTSERYLKLHDFFLNTWIHFAAEKEFSDRQIYLRLRLFCVCTTRESTSIYICADYLWQCARRSNIYLCQIWHCGIENATFDIPYLCSQNKGKKCRCMINCCPDKSSREMVEDNADDRSIMPQRRLEKPTIERWSCHSILQNAPHQRVSLCHLSRQDEITHSDIFHLSLKLC